MNKTVAATVICIALGLHLTLLYLVHGHIFSSSLMGSKAYMEHTQAADVKSVEETKRKQEQLEELFQTVVRPMEAERPNVDHSDLATLEIPPIREQIEQETVFSSDDFLTTDLIHATEVLPQIPQGILAPSLDSSGPAVKAGIEHSPISESYLEAILPSGAIATAEDFTLDIQVARRTTGGGYLFRIELVPKPNVKFRRIRQNYFFLIDRSHSIRSVRYEYTRQAVLNALNLLKPEDTFNILFFDDHVLPFSNENVPWTHENVAKARQFITQQKVSGLFATTDLYASLGKIVPNAVAETEVNTAILLSDGITYLTTNKQRESIEKWTRQNSGKVSLFSLAAGKGNHLALLDLLCFFNRGSLTYAELDQDIENRLTMLLQAVQNPVCKEITVMAIRPLPDVEIALYPQKGWPNLYEHTPFVIYGTINRLQDFQLFYQGKYYERSLDIKQTVSFAKAKQGDSASLEKRLALYKAYDCYAQFLKDGKMFHLSQAKRLLQPFKIPAAFQ